MLYCYTETVTYKLLYINFYVTSLYVITHKLLYCYIKLLYYFVICIFLSTVPYGHLSLLSQCCYTDKQVFYIVAKNVIQLLGVVQKLLYC